MEAVSLCRGFGLHRGVQIDGLLTWCHPYQGGRPYHFMEAVMDVTIVRLRLDLRGKEAKIQTFRAVARGRRAMHKSVWVLPGVLSDRLADGSVGRALLLPGFENS